MNAISFILEFIIDCVLFIITIPFLILGYVIDYIFFISHRRIFSIIMNKDFKIGDTTYFKSEGLLGKLEIREGIILCINKDIYLIQEDNFDKSRYFRYKKELYLY